MRIIVAADHGFLRHGLVRLIEREPGAQVVAETAELDRVGALADANPADAALLCAPLDPASTLSTLRALRSTHPRLSLVLIWPTRHLPFSLSDAFRAGLAACIAEHAVTGELVPALAAIRRGGRFLSEELAGSLFTVDGSDPADPEASPGSSRATLSEREREILGLLVQGKTSSEIALILGISEHTVASHRRRLMGKLGAANIAELVRTAIGDGLIGPLP